MTTSDLSKFLSTSVMLWLARLTTNPLARARSRARAIGSKLTQLFILPNGLVDKWVSREILESKLWKLKSHSGHVSRRNGLIFITLPQTYFQSCSQLSLYQQPFHPFASSM